MTDQGKANYEAYRAKAGRPGVSAEPLPEYEQLPMALQYAFDAGAGAVERWAADCPVDEDAPGNEPAKVIVVTESYAGRRLGERRYLADRYERNGNSLIIWRDGESVAEYLFGRWANVRRADAEASVLAEVREAAICTSDDGEQCGKCNRHVDAIVPGVEGILHAYRHQNSLLLAEREQLRRRLGQLPAGQEPPGSAVSVEEHRWYAVVRDGVDGEVVKVIGYRGDSGISCYDSLAAWEAADQ